MNKKIHISWRSNISIILTFAIMSILSGALMYHAHFVGVGWDLEFHWQRIFEIRKSLLTNGTLPMVSLNEFSQSGSAVMSMYPNFSLIPFVILTFIIKSQVALYNIMFMLGSFLCFLICYFSSYTFKSNKTISFIFSVSYTLSTLILSSFFNGLSFGTLASVYFLPLVFFGFLSLLENNKWIELSLGMIGIVLSHVISSGISILFLTIMFLININKFKSYERVISLIKAITVTVLTTSIFWLPFITLKFNNDIYIPAISDLQGTSFSILFSSIDNIVSAVVSLSGILGLIFSVINYKKMSGYLKQMFFVSIFFMIMTSNLFPWSILSHTFIIHLQYTMRLYVIPQTILCYLFAFNISIFMEQVKNRFLWLSSIVLSILFLQLGAQETLVNNYRNRPELTSPYNYNINFIVKNNKEFNNLLNSEHSSHDYYPQSSISKMDDIFNHVATYGNNKYLTVKPQGNGEFYFKAPQKINKLSLPFLYYNDVNYQVKLDGKTVKGYSNINSFMTIDNINKGNHHVQIIVNKSKSEIASYILSTIGLFILIIAIIRNFLLNRKNK